MMAHLITPTSYLSHISLRVLPGLHRLTSWNKKPLDVNISHQLCSKNRLHLDLERLWESSLHPSAFTLSITKTRLAVYMCEKSSWLGIRLIAVVDSLLLKHVLENVYYIASNFGPVHVFFGINVLSMAFTLSSIASSGPTVPSSHPDDLSPAPTSPTGEHRWNVDYFLLSDLYEKSSQMEVL